MPNWLSSGFQSKRLSYYWKRYEGSKNRVVVTILRSYISSILLTSVLQFFCVIGELTSPFLLQRIIDFIKDIHNESLNDQIIHGVILIGTLSLVRLITALTSQRVDFQQRTIGIQSMMGLGAIIYKKTLKLSNKSCKSYNQGKVMNLIHMDTMRVANIVNQLSNGISLVFTIALSLYLLYYFLGVIALVGILVCAITILINYFMAKFNRKYQKKIMELKDERIKKTNEALQSVKILKMYGWCDLFKEFINKVRIKEISTMQTKSCISGLFISSLYFFPKLMGIVTFFMYAAFNGVPSMGIVFATINVFDIMSTPLRTFPWYISAIIDAFVSGKRIQNFLETEEIPKTYNLKEENLETETALEINGCDFTWDDFIKDEERNLEEEKINSSVIEQNSKSDLSSPLLENDRSKSQDKSDNEEIMSRPSMSEDMGDNLRLMSKVKRGMSDSFSTSENNKEESKEEGTETCMLPLRDINLKVKKGEFVFIVGEIGSGKSSLLQAIIGDLKMRPSNENSDTDTDLIKKSGKFAYVEQHPWIQNGTIMNNVLYMKEYDEKIYKEALKICELEEDIAILPAGDMTEIGERGINLSGGQKARVSLARAVYSDRDIYLLDDPLSALDSNVKGKIFHNCIIGKLANKTRILASHCIEFLDKADRIIVLDKGEIIFNGIYSDFMKNERFVALVNKIHLTGKKPTIKKEEKKSKSHDDKEVKKGSGEIISKEDQEQDAVSFDVYKRYVKALGGVVFKIGRAHV